MRTESSSLDRDDLAQVGEILAGFLIVDGLGDQLHLGEALVGVKRPLRIGEIGIGHGHGDEGIPDLLGAHAAEDGSGEMPGSPGTGSSREASRCRPWSCRRCAGRLEIVVERDDEVLEVVHERGVGRDGVVLEVSAGSIRPSPKARFQRRFAMTFEKRGFLRGSEPVGEGVDGMGAFADDGLLAEQGRRGHDGQGGGVVILVVLGQSEGTIGGVHIVERTGKGSPRRPCARLRPRRRRGWPRPASSPCRSCRLSALRARGGGPLIPREFHGLFRHGVAVRAGHAVGEGGEVVVIHLRPGVEGMVWHWAQTIWVRERPGW